MATSLSCSHKLLRRAPCHIYPGLQSTRVLNYSHIIRNSHATSLVQHFSSTPSAWREKTFKPWPNVEQTGEPIRFFLDDNQSLVYMQWTEA